MTPRVWLRAISVAVLAVSLTSTAAASWSDDFTGGTTQQSWYTLGLNASFGPSGTFTAGVISGDVFELQDLTTAASGGSIIGVGVVNELFNNVLVSAVINPLGDNDMNRDIGLIARADLTYMNVYALTVDLTSLDVDLTRSDGGAQTELDNAKLTGLSATDSVYLEFELQGSYLEGRVYDSQGGTLLQTVQAFDSTYTQGVCGVLGSIESPTSAFRATFDNVSAYAVPEPSTLAMLAGLGVVGMLGYLRRRRSG